MKGNETQDSLAGVNAVDSPAGVPTTGSNGLVAHHSTKPCAERISSSLYISTNLQGTSSGSV